MPTVTTFFNALSKRMSNETSLSDITYALAISCKPFMKAFMDEFGFFEFVIDQPWTITRENPAGASESRPDFVVEQEPLRYIIENKINDRNYHFQQYYESYSRPSDRRSFISAYSLDEDIKKESEARFGFKTSRWKDFADHLEQNLAALLFGDDTELVRGYVAYVRKVCSIMALKEVRFSSLLGLHSFLNVLTSVISDYSKNGLEISISNSYNGRAFGENWSGKYVRVVDTKTHREIWPLYAINYHESDTTPSICIWFEKDWNTTIFKAAKTGRIVQNADTKYVVHEDKEAGEYVEFRLSESNFRLFSNAKLDEQLLTLRRFFDSVLDTVLKHI